MKQYVRKVKIIGTGSYTPETIYTNKYLESIVDTNSDWIREKLGITERRIASEDQSTSDLAELAAKKAIENARKVGLDSGLKYVYTGNIPGDEGESTFCPQCHEKALQRWGFKIVNNCMKGNHCKECGCEIEGVWK